MGGTDASLEQNADHQRNRAQLTTRNNALAETVNGYYKSELIYGPARPGPWRTVADVELATLGWVHWHNNSRLHGYLDDIPPAEFEAAFYATKRTDQPLVEIQ
jgi:putative transposase